MKLDKKSALLGAAAATGFFALSYALSDTSMAAGPSAPGDASFDAADRLAIINLFGAYAQNYDAAKPDEFLSAFTDTAELTYMSGQKVLAEVVRRQRPWDCLG